MTLLLVLLAGALGAAARYVVEDVVSRHARTAWPWGTFTVNVTGCFAAGMLTGLGHETARTVLAVGLAGSYTTFSAYAVEIVKVDGESSRAAAVAYALGSLGLGTLAAGLGVLLAE